MGYTYLLKKLDIWFIVLLANVAKKFQCIYHLMASKKSEWTLVQFIWINQSSAGSWGNHRRYFNFVPIIKKWTKLLSLSILLLVEKLRDSYFLTFLRIGPNENNYWTIPRISDPPRKKQHHRVGALLVFIDSKALKDP